MKIYLVQGVFFQLGRYTVWSGVLCPRAKGDREPEGEIEDLYGRAVVSEVSLDEEAGNLSFVKRYAHRRDFIRYNLTRQPDGLWEGTYSGSETGVDAVRCVLSAVEENFFVPPALSPVSSN